MKPEFELLQISWLACSQRIDKLKYSLSKNQALFPLALESLELITDSQEESIDALILRYSQKFPEHALSGSICDPLRLPLSSKLLMQLKSF